MPQNQYVALPVYSNEGPWVQDGPAPGGSYIQTMEIMKKKIQKSSSSEPLCSDFEI